MTPEKLKHLKSESISSVFPLAVINYAAQLGYPAEKILRHTNITLTQLQQPSARINAVEMGAIVYNLMLRCNDPSLGFKLGLASTHTKIGLLGFGMMSCNTYREALGMSLKYVRTITPFYSLTLSETEHHAIVEVKESTTFDLFRDMAFDTFFAECWSIASSLLAPDQLDNAKRNTQIWFDRPEPDYFEEFKHQLPEVHWNMPTNKILYNKEMLNYKIKTANPISARIVMDQCEHEMALLGYCENIVDKVRAQLVSRDSDYPDLPHVANTLHMSDRTLKRKLHQKGITFLQLLDDVRYRDSLNLLQSTALTIEDISVRIGYNTPANFSRAFKKWSGKTPSTCRSNSWREI